MNQSLGPSWVLLLPLTERPITSISTTSDSFGRCRRERLCSSKRLWNISSNWSRFSTVIRWRTKLPGIDQQTVSGTKLPRLTCQARGDYRRSLCRDNRKLWKQRIGWSSQLECDERCKFRLKNVHFPSHICMFLIWESIVLLKALLWPWMELFCLLPLRWWSLPLNIDSAPNLPPILAGSLPPFR